MFINLGVELDVDVDVDVDVHSVCARTMSRDLQLGAMPIDKDGEWQGEWRFGMA